MNKIESWLGMEKGGLSDALIEIGINLAIAFAILVIGFWVANRLGKVVSKVLKKNGKDESLIGFFD